MPAKKPAPAPARAAPARRSPEQEARTRAPARPAPAQALSTAPRSAGLPAALRERAREHLGEGLSGAMEDNLVPLVYFLQPLSPAASPNNPAYVDGARPGDLWLRGADDPIIDGEAGAEFQPCYFGKEVLEWLPNRGGLVGRHKIMPADAVQVENPQSKGRFVWKSRSGNELVESRFYAGFIRPLTETGDARWLPYILPFKGTGHQAGRELMSEGNKKFDAGGPEPDPIYLHRYRISTFWRKNDKGEWHQPKVEYLGPIATEDEFERGMRTHVAFRSGALKAQVDRDEQAPAGGSDPEDI